MAEERQDEAAQRDISASFNQTRCGCYSAMLAEGAGGERFRPSVSPICAQAQKRPRARTFRLVAGIGSAVCLIALTAFIYNCDDSQTVLAMSGQGELLIKIPPGVVGGQQFTASLPGYGDFMVQAPPGSIPGQSVEVPQSALPSRPALKSDKEFNAKIPKGLHAGQNFKVQVPGHDEVSVPVAAGEQGGEIETFEVPRQVRGGGSQGSKAIPPTPSKQPLAQETLRFVVPAGSKPGTTIQVRTSDGTRVPVELPSTIAAGETMQITVPAPKQAKATQTLTRSGHTPALAGDTSSGISDEEAAASIGAAVSAAVEGAIQTAVENAPPPPPQPASAPPPPPPPPPQPAAVPPAQPQPAPAAAVPPQQPPPAPLAQPQAAAPPSAYPPPSSPPTAPAESAPAAAAAAVVEKEEQEEGGMAGLGHRDDEAAFNHHHPIEAAAVPDALQGQVVDEPTASTNKYDVEVYPPLPPPGRRTRGVATLWEDAEHAWEYDASRQRKVNLHWLDKPGVWEDIDAWMGHPKPDRKYLYGEDEAR